LGFVAVAFHFGECSVEFGGYAGLVGDGLEELELVLELAEEMSEDHSSAAVGDFREGGSAALGEDFGGEILEVEYAGAEISAEVGGAGELTLSEEGGLAGDDVIDGGAEGLGLNRSDDSIEAPLCFAGAGAAQDELDEHWRDHLAEGKQ
jgi:hypothetical protein